MKSYSVDANGLVTKVNLYTSEIASVNDGTKRVENGVVGFGNENQGFSYYDGYNALGYYQFDRRYSLVGFMRYCVNYDAATFSMFQAPLARAAELSDSSTSVYDSAATPAQCDGTK